MVAEKLKGARDFVAEQWWRFLIGIQFLTLVNFTLLVITASDKLKAIMPARISEMVLVLVPLALLGAWLLGLVLERYVRFPQAQEKAATERSPTWRENFRKLDELSARLGKIERKMG